MDLSRKKVRDRLPARKEPYWQRLAEGAYLGFYAKAQTWHARYRKRAGQDPKGKPKFKQEWKALGEALEFDEAKRRAEEWLAQFSGSPVRTTRRDTVRAALETYLADLKRHGRAGAAKEALGRFTCVVWEDAIASVKLEDATQDDFLEWRDRLTDGRQPRTINRHVRSVVAGLNRAKQLGHVGNPEAWHLKPLTDDVEDEGDTAVFLAPEQRRAIIEKAQQQLGEFLRGLELTGARPKELAAAKSDDFDGQTLRLAHRKGRPPKLRVRHVVLGQDGVEFFKRQAKGKVHRLLFTRHDGEAWTNNYWARELRKVIAAVNAEARGKDRIPAGASAYSFRHARISELLQIHGVDPLTVAAQTGTSVAMIEKTYFKFIPNAMREKLAAARAGA
jgi:integrase